MRPSEGLATLEEIIKLVRFKSPFSMSQPEFTPLIIDPGMSLPMMGFQSPKACSNAIALVVPAEAGIQSPQLFIKVTPLGIRLFD